MIDLLDNEIVKLENFPLMSFPFTEEVLKIVLSYSVGMAVAYYSR
jgi:hypothetical protein